MQESDNTSLADRKTASSSSSSSSSSPISSQPSTSSSSTSDSSSSSSSATTLDAKRLVTESEVATMTPTYENIAKIYLQFRQELETISGPPTVSVKFFSTLWKGDASRAKQPDTVEYAIEKKRSEAHELCAQTIRDKFKHIVENHNRQRPKKANFSEISKEAASQLRIEIDHDIEKLLLLRLYAEELWVSEFREQARTHLTIGISFLKTYRQKLIEHFFSRDPISSNVLDFPPGSDGLDLSDLTTPTSDPKLEGSVSQIEKDTKQDGKSIYNSKKLNIDENVADYGRYHCEWLESCDIILRALQQCPNELADTEIEVEGFDKIKEKLAVCEEKIKAAEKNSDTSEASSIGWLLMGELNLDSAKEKREHQKLKIVQTLEERYEVLAKFVESAPNRKKLPPFTSLQRTQLELRLLQNICRKVLDKTDVLNANIGILLDRMDEIQAEASIRSWMMENTKKMLPGGGVIQLTFSEQGIRVKIVDKNKRKITPDQFSVSDREALTELNECARGILRQGGEIILNHGMPGHEDGEVIRRNDSLTPLKKKPEPPSIPMLSQSGQLSGLASSGSTSSLSSSSSSSSFSSNFSSHVLLTFDSKTKPFSRLKDKKNTDGAQDLQKIMGTIQIFMNELISFEKPPTVSLNSIAMDFIQKESPNFRLKEIEELYDNTIMERLRHIEERQEKRLQDSEPTSRKETGNLIREINKDAEQLNLLMNYIYEAEPLALAATGNAVLIKLDELRIYQNKLIKAFLILPDDELNDEKSVVTVPHNPSSEPICVQPTFRNFNIVHKAFIEELVHHKNSPTFSIKNFGTFSLPPSELNYLGTSQAGVKKNLDEFESTVMGYIMDAYNALANSHNQRPKPKDFNSIDKEKAIALLKQIDLDEKELIRLNAFAAEFFNLSLMTNSREKTKDALRILEAHRNALCEHFHIDLLAGSSALEEIEEEEEEEEEAEHDLEAAAIELSRQLSKLPSEISSSSSYEMASSTQDHKTTPQAPSTTEEIDSSKEGELREIAPIAPILARSLGGLLSSTATNTTSTTQEKPDNKNFEPSLGSSPN